MISAFAVVIVLLAGAPPLPAVASGDSAASGAGSAQAQATIERFHDGLLAVMKQGETLGFPGRVARLEPLVKETFSLEFMTRLIVGQKWQSLGEDRRNAILTAFTDWVVATYANRFSSFDGEQFKIKGVSDGGRGTVVVNTEIVPSDDSPVSLGYRMLDGKVIDIYLNGSVSQLATWRSEFSSIIDKEGIDGLIDKLNQRTKKLATGTS